MIHTKAYRTALLPFFFLFFSLKVPAQVKILENQIGIGTLTPTAAIDIRSASNFEASRFQVGNLAATSKIQLLSGKKGDERSFLLFSPQDTFILARQNTDTTEVMRFSPDGSFSALGNFNLQRAENDFSIYIGAGTGTATNGSNRENVFIGHLSGQNNQTGSRNTFVGKGAGSSNQIGFSNTFLGVDAGTANIDGTENIALGTGAGKSNTSGSANIFLGDQAGFGHVSGNVNIFIGRNSGLGSQTGSANTFVGNFAGPLDINDVLEKSIAIGNGAKVDCSNCAIIGGTGIDAVNLGLGVPAPTAKLDVDGTVRIRNLPSGNGNFVVADNDGNLFLAAAVPLAANENTTSLEAENLALRAELETVKERLQQLERWVRDLADRQEETPSIKSQPEAAITGAVLRQNQPNPFRDFTRIEYFIPESVNKAVLKITDARGALIKSIEINSKGNGETILRPFALRVGTYFYSLVLDGHLLETKKMVLTAN